MVGPGSEGRYQGEALPSPPTDWGTVRVEELPCHPAAFPLIGPSFSSRVSPLPGRGRSLRMTSPSFSHTPSNVATHQPTSRGPLCDITAPFQPTAAARGGTPSPAHHPFPFLPLLPLSPSSSSSHPSPEDRPHVQFQKPRCPMSHRAGLEWRRRPPMRWQRGRSARSGPLTAGGV